MGLRGLLAAGGSLIAIARAEPVVTNLPPVVVTGRAGRESVDPPGGTEIADSAAALTGVETVRQGAQTDLSVRGSAFSGAGISVGGLSLRNPQTEHFQAETPFPPGLFAAPRRLVGIEMLEQSDGHLVGSIAISPLPIETRTRLRAGAGEFSRDWQEAIGQGSLSARAGVGAFGWREHAERLDYPDNDMDRAGAGGQWQWRDRRLRADALFGHQRKEFGARGYYGVRPDWDADERTEDTLAAATARWEGGHGATVRLSGMHRVFRDDYRLYWTRPGIYENHHRSIVSSAFADGQTQPDRGLDLIWRAGAEAERLRSERLGDHRRRRAVGALLPGWRCGPLQLRAGLRAEGFDADEPAWLPQAGVELDIGGGHRLHAAHTETVRRPSFTELNYESPGSLGNAGLDRQRLRAEEAGWRWSSPAGARMGAAAFLHRSEDTIDWVLGGPEASQWVATNLGDVETVGLELEASAPITRDLAARADYTVLSRESETDAYAGRYVLDYPEHVLRVGASWQVHRTVRLDAMQAMRVQSGNPVRRSGDTAWDGTLGLVMTPLGSERLTLGIEAANVWDEDFELPAGLPAAGRRVSVSIGTAW